MNERTEKCFGLGGPTNVLVHALFDKVKKWVCREWSVIAATFPSKKGKTNKPILCAATAHKKTPPQIQKYILPKPFTKIKWNSTCSGRVGKKHTHTKLFKRIVCAQTMHIAIWMQFCFCSWLTPSATVSNSNLSFIRKRAAVQQKWTAFDRIKRTQFSYAIYDMYVAVVVATATAVAVSARCRINIHIWSMLHLWVVAAIIKRDNFRNEILNAIWLN